MSSSLPNDLADFVQSEIAAGHYASEGDLVTDAVRLLQAERDEAITGIRLGIESMERGEGILLDDAISQLKARHGIEG